MNAGRNFTSLLLVEKIMYKSTEMCLWCLSIIDYFSKAEMDVEGPYVTEKMEWYICP